MIRLHHLNQSRSLRILWLLEELKQPYELVHYQRDAVTHLAPARLEQIHPLGKSPVIELDGQVIAESGAITEILIDRFAGDSLRPRVNTKEYIEYLQWINFAESSLMVPLLLELFIQSAGINDNPFLSGYIQQEKGKLLNYLDHAVADKSFIVANQLSGADFMLSFDLIMLEKKGQLDHYANIKAYVQKLSQLDSYQRAINIEAEHYK